ncbi:Tuliposide A-converting enzyme 2, chloroplastic [Madurella mycetomatis]|uniref:Tuliposide A-converting enzyme 2, chloroplastic n=1 Tax=Madurella mycetomatis TaxID=100816 RepID=A0A175VXX6_9PEZI|nr:Tuliposide A-converting enzyme 2, chloroplastic [Madurella mycetomatis]
MALFPAERRLEVLADIQARFDRLDVAYKSVNGTPIETAILIPKTLSSNNSPQNAPVLVHFHGGGLVCGTNPEPFFLVDWIRDLAYSAGAILLSPAYRLVPESKAVDSLTDVADFWAWLHHHDRPLSSVIHPLLSHVTPDFSRVATVGESAGGFLALQSALAFNGTAKLRAAIVQYGAIFSDVEAWNPDPAVGVDRSGFEEVVRGYVRGLKEGEIQVSAPWPEKAELVLAALQGGFMRELSGDDPEGRMTLEYAITRVKEEGSLVPPIWFIQGSEDTLVAKEAMDEVVERLKREVEGVQVKYTIREGDHGFDVGARLEDDWVAEGVEWVNGFWLG